MVRTCHAAYHVLRECKEFWELLPAARLDLMRKHNL
jgi:hypothetical protein